MLRHGGSGIGVARNRRPVIGNGGIGSEESRSGVNGGMAKIMASISNQSVAIANQYQRHMPQSGSGVMAYVSGEMAIISGVSAAAAMAYQ